MVSNRPSRLLGADEPNRRFAFLAFLGRNIRSQQGLIIATSRSIISLAQQMALSCHLQSLCYHSAEQDHKPSAAVKSLSFPDNQWR